MTVFLMCYSTVKFGKRKKHGGTGLFGMHDLSLRWSHSPSAVMWLSQLYSERRRHALTTSCLGKTRALDKMQLLLGQNQNSRGKKDKKDISANIYFFTLIPYKGKHLHTVASAEEYISLKFGY